jgi:hypothetical protein
MPTYINVVSVENDIDFYRPETPHPLFTLAHRHRDYVFGDDTFRDISELPDADDVISLPVYMYEHGGITINTTGFSCPWDSGKVGVVYVYKDAAQQHGYTLDEAGVEQIKDALRAHVQMWDCYITRNIWSWAVYEVDTDDVSCPEDLSGLTGEERFCECVEIAGGYFGYEGLKQAQEDGDAALEAWVKRAAEAEERAALAAAKEAAEQHYWACRDVVTS